MVETLKSTRNDFEMTPATFAHLRLLSQENIVQITTKSSYLSQRFSISVKAERWQACGSLNVLYKYSIHIRSTEMSILIFFVSVWYFCVSFLLYL